MGEIIANGAKLKFELKTSETKVSEFEEKFKNQLKKTIQLEKEQEKSILFRIFSQKEEILLLNSSVDTNAKRRMELEKDLDGCCTRYLYFYCAEKKKR